MIDLEMSECEACGRSDAGLKSALGKQKARNKRLRAKVVELDGYRTERREAQRQRDAMATEMWRARRREAALKHAHEELRFQHERLMEAYQKATGAVFAPPRPREPLNPR